jgi:orotate phosphoribosyltransferase
MEAYQRDFLDLTLEREVLRFGSFQLKSGRTSPYFFNMGRIDSGAALARLGSAYAAAALRAEVGFDMLFGPAYKGIALAAATAIALATEHGRDLPWAYNRKEAKDHGEGGLMVGAPLKGRVVIIDDVITDGASKRESVDMIRAAGAEPVAVLIAMDRMERKGSDDNLSARSSVEEFEAAYGMPVLAIATLADLLQYLQTNDDPALRSHLARVTAYRDRYGV